MSLVALPKPAPEQEVIDRLEWALEKARSGEAIAAAIAVQLVDGSMATSFVTGERASMFAILGGVHYLAHRISEDMET